MSLSELPLGPFSDRGYNPLVRTLSMSLVVSAAHDRSHFPSTHALSNPTNDAGGAVRDPDTVAASYVIDMTQSFSSLPRIQEGD